MKNGRSRSKIKKIPREWLVLIILVILAVGISFFEWNKNSSDQFKSTLATTQSIKRIEKEEGSVTVVVEYLQDKSDKERSVFLILLDTHSVNFDAFSFQKNVTLEKEDLTQLPLQVVESGGGHHRKAEVIFHNVSPPFVITLNNLAGVSKREFQFPDL